MLDIVDAATDRVTKDESAMDEARRQAEAWVEARRVHRPEAPALPQAATPAPAV